MLPVSILKLMDLATIALRKPTCTFAVSNVLEVSLGFKHTCQLLDNPTAVDSAPKWADVACSNHE
jgi:hypothetical protein